MSRTLAFHQTVLSKEFYSPNWLHSSRYRCQDVHIQSYIMVIASGRWLGVHLDLLSSLLTGAVALAAVLVSQDAGRYWYCNVSSWGFISRRSQAVPQFCRLNTVFSQPVRNFPRSTSEAARQKVFEKFDFQRKFPLYFSAKSVVGTSSLNYPLLFSLLQLTLTVPEVSGNKDILVNGSKKRLSSFAVIRL